MLLLCLCPLLNIIAQNQRQYKPLIKQLNKMLKNAEAVSWMYEDNFKTIQPYEIEDNRLSVIFEIIYNDKPVIHKYEAPLDDADDFVLDIYYVLSFKTNSVIVSELVDGQWIIIDERSYFHLGKPKDGEQHKWSRTLRKEFNNAVPGLKNEFEWLD